MIAISLKAMVDQVLALLEDHWDSESMGTYSYISPLPPNPNYSKITGKSFNWRCRYIKHCTSIVSIVQQLIFPSMQLVGLIFIPARYNIFIVHDDD